MPGRTSPFQTSVSGMSDGSDSYRYGFNGKENDFEPKNGQGTQQDYGMRIYDPRLGKFLSVDPLTKSFPSLTPYQFASNSPIANVDLDGLEASFFMYVYSEHINGEARFKLIPKKMVDAKMVTYLGTIHTNLTDVSFVKGTDGHWHQIPKEWEKKSFSEAGDFRAVFKMIDSWKINDEAYDAVIKGEALQKVGQKAEAALGVVMLADGVANIASGLNSGLMKILANKGVKFNPKDVLNIGRNSSGKIIFLEKGNSKAGLTHILEQHTDDFVNSGIAKEDIGDFVFDAATNGKKVGTQNSRDVFETTYKGEKKPVAVTIGSNGFIVGANPTSGY